MTNLSTDLPPVTANRRACLDPGCLTAWTAVDSRAPEKCPECGGPSADEDVVEALRFVEPRLIEAIRRDERLRLAALLDKDAGAIGEFVAGGPQAVRLVAYMLTL